MLCPFDSLPHEKIEFMLGCGLCTPKLYIEMKSMGKDVRHHP